MAGFQGWPKAALEFFGDLEDNNDREWFKANKARYEEHVLGPAKLLAAELAPLGQASFFRPYRDTRFHAGPPIKESIAFKLGDVRVAGGYVELSLDGLLLGAGVYMTQSDQVERWRAAVGDGRKAASLTKAIAKGEAVGLALGPPDLKRVPRGYAPDHPRAELLKHRRFALMHRDPKPGRWLHTPEAGRRIRATLEAAKPFMRWLETHVGPSTKPRQSR